MHPLIHNGDTFKKAAVSSVNFGGVYDTHSLFYTWKEKENRHMHPAFPV